MAGCRVVKASMDTSVTNLLNYSTQYGEAATTFVAAFKAAIEAMEGDAKDALVEFFETNIEGLVTKDILVQLRAFQNFSRRMRRILMMLMLSLRIASEEMVEAMVAINPPT